jgi:predicted dehydrogenase
MNRRDFLKQTAVTGAAAALSTRQAAAQTRPPAPSDRIALGLIGSGARGQELLRAALKVPGVEIVALCDAYTGRAERARARTEGRAEILPDYPAVLGRSDVDAVIVATPDHLHTPVTLAALDAGKDVYVEKPMTYTIEEGTRIVDAARRTRRIVQVGSQGMSSALNAKARELVQSGRLGKVTMIRASYNRNTAGGAWIYPIPPDAGPQTVNWEQFLGPAPKRPFSLERFFRWRCYWDYSGGIPGDLFVHLLTTIHFVMNAVAPANVIASGELYRWKESREVPDTVNAVLVYPEGFTANLSSTFNNQSASDSGFEILGTEASLSFRGGRLSLTRENVREDNGWILASWPEALEKAYYADPKVQARETPDTWPQEMRQESERWAEWGESTDLVHMRNFIDAVRSRRPPAQDAEAGHHAASGAHMVNLSIRQKKPIEWDFAKNNIRS